MLRLGLRFAVISAWPAGLLRKDQLAKFLGSDTRLDPLCSTSLRSEGKPLQSPARDTSRSIGEPNELSWPWPQLKAAEPFSFGRGVQDALRTVCLHTISSSTGCVLRCSKILSLISCLTIDSRSQVFLGSLQAPFGLQCSSAAWFFEQ